jgi:23S rRNA (adenine-N6)-dimethyltransferase
VPAGGPRWGWHRLDERWAHRLVAGAAIAPGDLVLDIGAGDGILTKVLVAAGARVVAVELHPARAALLRRRFAECPVTVVQADAADLRLPRRPFKAVANPPFGVTTALLRRLLHRGSRLEHAALVLPAWAVGRWTANRGRASADFELDAGPWIPRAAFHPPPPDRARVLVVTRR